MQIQHPFATVSAGVDGEILAVLARVESAFTVGDLQLLIPGRSAAGIRKSVRRLVTQGSVTDMLSGRTHGYQLNREHVAAPAIIALAGLEDTLHQRIRNAIADWVEAPLYVAIFGSAARGDMSVSSDIDIVLIRPNDANDDTFQAQTSDLATRVRAWTGNDTRPLTYAQLEIVGMANSDPVLASIAAEGRPLIGEPRWFRRTIHQTPVSR